MSALFPGAEAAGEGTSELLASDHGGGSGSGWLAVLLAPCCAWLTRRASSQRDWTSFAGVRSPEAAAAEARVLAAAATAAGALVAAAGVASGPHYSTLLPLLAACAM